MTEEQKTHLWKLIDDYAGADVTVAVSEIYDNGEPEEFENLRRAKDAIDNFMETI
ncbi:hypothetical protein SEA1_gp0112 [Salmonella phage SEA1]|nr:hypothetical protein SEA1_gp0112 [Salmonella phage SEA1]